jgi:hypothetical protein
MRKKPGAILGIGLLVVLGVVMLFSTGCGKEYPYGTGGPGFTELLTPTPMPVTAAELPDPYNQVEAGMSYDQVTDLLDYPSTIQDIGGKRVYKYFVREGEDNTDSFTVNRLYINFMDEKVSDMMLSVP